MINFVFEWHCYNLVDFFKYNTIITEFWLQISFITKDWIIFLDYSTKEWSHLTMTKVCFYPFPFGCFSLFLFTIISVVRVFYYSTYRCFLKKVFFFFLSPFVLSPSAWVLPFTLMSSKKQWTSVVSTLGSSRRISRPMLYLLLSIGWCSFVSYYSIVCVFSMCWRR